MITPPPGVINIYPGVLHIHFILLISLHRLVRCALPVKSGALFTRNKAYLVVAGVWVYCTVFPSCLHLAQLEISQLITDSCTVDTYHVGTNYQIMCEQTRSIIICLWVLYVCVPFLLVLLCIALLALISLKLTGVVWNKNRKILMTTFMIGGSFLVSWSPHIAFSVWRTFDSTLRSSSFNRIPQYFHMLSFCVNPVIYTVVNRSFKNFMREHARKVSEATATRSTPGSAPKGPGESTSSRVRRWTNFEIIFENSSLKKEGGERKPGEKMRRFSYAAGAFKPSPEKTARVRDRVGRFSAASHPGVMFNVEE